MLTEDDLELTIRKITYGGLVLNDGKQWILRAEMKEKNIAIEIPGTFAGSQIKARNMALEILNRLVYGEQK